MGRKKPTSAAATAAEEGEGDPPVAVKKKNKKKGAFVVDDDEYMVVDQLDDDNSLRSSQKLGSMNGKAAAEDVDEDLSLSMKKNDRKKVSSAVDNDEHKKGNKSGRTVLEEDADAILAELEASRKPTSNTYKSDPVNTELIHAGSEQAFEFSGSKKTKKKKGKGLQEQEDVYAILAEIESPDEQKQGTFHPEQEDTVEFSQELPDVEDFEAEKLVEYAGSKKKKKNKGKEAHDQEGAHSSLAEIEGMDERKQDAFRLVPENNVAFSQAILDVEDLDAETTVEFAGSKKKKKKKGKETREQQDAHSVLAEIEGEDEWKQDAFHSVPENTVDFSQAIREVNDLEAETTVEFAGSTKKKKKKDKKLQEQDVYSVLAEIEGADEQKQGSFHSEQEDTVEFSQEILEVEDFEAEMMVELAGSKKKKKKKGKETQEQQDVYSILTEIEGADEQKQHTFHSVPADAVDLIQAIQETEDFEVEFAGSKKKKKKKGKETREQEDVYAILTDELEWQEELGPNVSQNATKSVQSGSEPEDLETGKVVEFSGSKKKKKKKGKETAKEEQDLDAIVAEPGGPKALKSDRAIPTEPVRDVLKPLSGDAVELVQPSCPAPESLEDLLTPSKTKSKKGKKSGRTAQEEEDLEAILAELEGSKVVKPDEAIPVESIEAVSNLMSVAPIESSQVPVAQENLEAEETFESAAAKKKKKKKEKEKEKAKAAAERAPAKEAVEEKVETSKGKALEKKVPKHVREMQERLAKQREQEEKRRQEEEERRRKEEEEQRRLEELERQKEEAKRRRKEREKEKLLKKKQEGRLLTGKQKEEAKRLALMREQLLAQRGLSVDSDISVKEDAMAAPKKPKYENKKKRRPQGADSVSFEETLDIEQEDQMIISHEESLVAVEPVSERDPEVEKFEEVQIEEEVQEEDEAEEDWDAKSWDDEVSLPAIKSSFAEEEENAVGPEVLAKQAVAPPPLPKKPVSSVKSTSEIKPAIENETKPAQMKSQQSNEEAGSDDESDSDDEDAETKRRRELTLKREARKAEALTKRSADDLRSPICCILGHVDTGKTKLLDCIRRTNVQEGEAGGITQQIGATYFPMENIRERTKELKTEASLKVPGLLVIDTPGHESFTNLRVRGSGLCDIAILVIDIMHGLEPQTIESLNLLKMRHTPFVVALNKVDRLYAWKTCPNSPIRAVLKQQTKDVVNEFEMRVNQIVNQLKEQGLNSELYFRNKEVRKYVSIVPTSAISGEGVPDLLMLLVQLTQKMMAEKLMYISEVQCTVLEVKVIEGLGTTIDVILVNGVLHEADQIVVCSMQGPIVTTIRALLTPHPMKELRVKGSYQHHKELKAAQGIKITAQGLEHAIAGTQLYIVGPDDDLEDVKEEAMQDMKNVMSRIDKSGEGVCVQASTLGSLEALLEFLKSPAVQIPVSGISIGPVHKRDVMRASVMLERKKKEYATILAFDVKVTPEARDLAEELGVRIFMADIIYHLFDQFTAYLSNIKEEKKKEAADEAVFPCVLKILPECIFNKKDPIILGVDVLEGVARVGTPLCVPSRDGVDIGRIVSMEVNHKVVESAKKGQKVAMKIVGSNTEETQKMFGRHFDLEDELVSHITRRSIDVLKESYRDELSMDEWRLLVKLKKLFEIP